MDQKTKAIFKNKYFLPCKYRDEPKQSWSKKNKKNFRG